MTAAEAEEEFGLVPHLVAVGREVRIREVDRRILDTDRARGGVVALVQLGNLVGRIDHDEDRRRTGGERVDAHVGRGECSALHRHELHRSHRQTARRGWSQEELNGNVGRALFAQVADERRDIDWLPVPGERR